MIRICSPAACWIVPSSRKSSCRSRQTGADRGSSAMTASEELAMQEIQRNGASAAVISSASPSESPSSGPTRAPAAA